MSSFSDIQEISYADTLKQLVEKCNYNFNTIRDSAGPRGKDGKTGETGARGKRGKSIHFVNYQFDDEASDENFGVTEAEDAIENEGLDVEVDDIVMFSNCYYANIDSIDEDGTIHVGVVCQFRGQRGLTGEQGEPGTGDMFVGTGSGITFNTEKGYSKLNLLASGQNTLNVGGAIGVFNSGTQVGTIGGTNGLDISSTGDMNLSSNNNIVVKKKYGASISIGNEVSIEALNKSIKINDNGIELNGVTKFGRDVTIGDNYNIKFETGSSQIKKDSVKTDETTTKTLKVVDNGGNSTVLSITGTEGLSVGNLKILTTGKITTESPIVYNGTILDIPKFSFSLYPKNMDTPANWASFGFDLCLRDVECLGETTPSSLNGNKIYFKFKIPLSDRVSTKYFMINNPTTQIGKLNINFEAITSNSTNSPEEILPDDFGTITQSFVKSDRIYSSSDAVYTEEVLRESLDIFVGDINLDSPSSSVKFEAITGNISIWKNYHAELLKNMLDVSSDPSKIKDMSNTFTRLKSSNENEGKYTFVMPKPTTPSDMFVWNFKIA